MPITKATASSVAPAAKGDLVVGNATNDSGVLSVGANNTVLTADSSTATGLKWAAAAGGGKVLQVVHGSTTTYASSSSSTFADTGLTATITPTSASSQILVIVNQNGIGKNSSFSTSSIMLRIDRGGTTYSISNALAKTATAQQNIISAGQTWLDSPATTSATTYKTQFASFNNNSAVFVQSDESSGSSRSTITLMEIGA
jgi:hypothetical protein